MLNQTLGYKAGELDGLNVSVIMPPPFAQRHNGYLRAAKAGSQTLNRPRKVLAVRKDKSVLPMDLKITRMSQGNESTLYLGVLHAIEDDDGSEAIAWDTWVSCCFDNTNVCVTRVCLATACQADAF